MIHNRKARKDYICDYCDSIIPKGSVYEHLKFKTGRYDDEDQVGVEFFSFRFCGKCGDEAPPEYNPPEEPEKEIGTPEQWEALLKVMRVEFV